MIKVFTTITKHFCLKRVATLCAIIFSISGSHAWSAESDHFSMYKYLADGFEVAFPQKPLEFRTDRGPSNEYVNSYQAVIINPISQYSVFVNHSPKRVFEDAAIAAYLDGIIRGLVTGSDEAVLKYTKQTKLLGFPAKEYQYTHKIKGVPVIGRGIVLIVDGEHIRLSQIHAPNDLNADKNFQRFVGSFRLLPIDGMLNKNHFEDSSRSISFSPPNGWKQGKPKFSQVVAIFANPAGHSITVLDSNTSTYVCENYRLELQGAQGVQDSGEFEARGRSIKWFKSTAHNASAGIRMTSVHYCMNTTRGSVILIGGAPEQTFFRSSNIFLKAATSMVVWR